MPVCKILLHGKDWRNLKIWSYPLFDLYERINYISELQICWQDFVRKKFSTNLEVYSKTNGILISNYFEPRAIHSPLIIDSQSFNDSSLTVANKPIYRQRRSITELAPMFVYQKNKEFNQSYCKYNYIRWSVK